MSNTTENKCCGKCLQKGTRDYPTGEHITTEACHNIRCDCHTTTDWEKEWRKYKGRGIVTHEIEFIRNLVSQRDTALVEAMEKEIADIRGEINISDEYKLGYRQGLLDAQALISNEEKSV